MIQEQIMQERLEPSDQFTQAYSTHQLVRTFQKRDHQGFLVVLSEVENVSPQLTKIVETIVKNKRLIKNMDTE